MDAEASLHGRIYSGLNDTRPSYEQAEFKLSLTQTPA